MEHATLVVAPGLEQPNAAYQDDKVALRVYAERGILTSTQIEAVAGTADELAGTQLELTPHGDVLLHGIEPHETAHVIAALRQAGLRTAESSSAEVTGDASSAAPGLQHVELSVPDGRVTPQQLRDLARLARTYADCELRITPTRNVLILNTPRANLSLMLREPVLRELRPA